jgi:aspartate/methionine/tyrosine aminotransferase
MEIRSQKLSDFFNIGRDLGWDVEQQRWTVKQLTSPEARSYTIGDIIEGGLPPELPLTKSGNRYGYPPLRERIVETMDYAINRDHVLITLGTQMSNFIAMSTLLEPGDEAIVETPSWEQPRVLCQALKAECKLLRRRHELDWKFDLDELKALMSPKVKLIYICHPNNPTGACLSRDELQAVCDIAAKHGSYVLSDEIYRGMEWSGELSPSVANLYERGVATSSVSKILGMSGTRLGWLATPDRDFLERCMELKYYITLHQQSRLDETIAMAALERQKFWSLARASMNAGRRNFDLVAGWMASNGTFRWVPPAGGFLSFPHYDLDLPSWDLCVRLIKEPYRTYIIPGSCYGYEHHVRLGFGPGTPAEDVEDGLAQISRFVGDFRSGRVEVEISGN